ncbi:MAG: adenylate/guanylate cyclase domain-containing protein, partial [Deltaproteobacteria bacterium]|nr:adenylate/guanylate cyclase domain-containing protein [Deltaproteobacteria bacterium]
VAYVRKEKVTLVQGAILQTWLEYEERLGGPIGDEGFAASSMRARCQRFANGLVIWENTTDPEGKLLEIGAWPSFTVEAPKVSAIAAIFDLRGSTDLAKEEPELVVKLARVLERSVQEELEKGSWVRASTGPFLKGTGDGVLLVAEVNASTSTRRLGEELVATCLKVVRRFRRTENALPIGCALETGKVLRVFRYGRTDYLGGAINQSGKLQSVAWNELVVGPRLSKILGIDGKRGKRLGSKGWRIDPKA